MTRNSRAATWPAKCAASARRSGVRLGRGRRLCIAYFDTLSRWDFKAPLEREIPAGPDSHHQRSHRARSCLLLLRRGQAGTIATTATQVEPRAVR